MKTENLMSEDYMNEDMFGQDAEFVDAEYDDDDDDEDIESIAEYDDDDDDGEFAEYDDDDDDDEQEDAEFLGAIAAPLIGGLAPSLIKGASSLIRRRHKRRRYRSFPRFHGGGGIRGVKIHTPRGAATLRLPKSVVPMSVYKRGIAKLQARDNRIISRLNRAQKDIGVTDKKAVRALAIANSTNANIRRLNRKHRKALSKLKEETKSNATMNLLMSMMQSQSITSQLQNHTHAADGSAENISSNNMSFLPLLMMSDGGDDNMGLMIAMMSMMGNQSN